ncbi:MAG: proline dehydrogenase family protein [Deltaproteobacteria bacterium]|nr:proline dehydrogenase family protein [Deltaproteobacteria bacterium]
MLNGPNFEDTLVAYKHLDDKALIRAHQIFSLMDQPILARVGPLVLELASRLGLPVSFLLRKTLFAHFCGGESLQACAALVESLKREQVGVVLDYAVEGSQSEESFDRCCDEILRSLAACKAYEQPFGVFKPTGIVAPNLLQNITEGRTLSATEEESARRGQQRFARIAQKAEELGISVMIDAEESWLQDAIDRWVEALMRERNTSRPVVYHTIQFYRKDRLGYLKQLLKTAEKGNFYLGLKLVRGAYLDKERERARLQSYPSPVHETKQDTDNNFNTALMFCWEHKDRISIFSGTHNEISTSLLTQAVDRDPSVERNDPRFVSAQLLGMSDNLTFNLARNGFRAMKYVPYGPVKAVLPYLARRARENSSITGQMARELAMLRKELARRKSVRS